MDDLLQRMLGLGLIDDAAADALTDAVALGDQTEAQVAAALSLHATLRRHAEEDSALGRSVKEALQVLADAYRLYGAEKVIGSFNGGKDAVVILHLMRAALAAHPSHATKLRVRARHKRHPALR